MPVVVHIIQYMASLIKHIRNTCSSEHPKRFIGRNSEELQPFYDEFWRILQNYEQAKKRNDPRDWTIIYQKLSDFQNELKSNEHYLAIWEFSFQNQIINGFTSDKELNDLKHKLKKTQSKLNKRDEQAIVLLSKLKALESIADVPAIEKNPVDENRRMRVLISQLLSKNEALKQSSLDNQQRISEVEKYYEELENIKSNLCNCMINFTLFKFFK